MGFYGGLGEGEGFPCLFNLHNCDDLIKWLNYSSGVRDEYTRVANYEIMHHHHISRDPFLIFILIWMLQVAQDHA